MSVYEGAARGALVDALDEALTRSIESALVVHVDGTEELIGCDQLALIASAGLEYLGSMIGARAHLFVVHADLECALAGAPAPTTEHPARPLGVVEENVPTGAVPGPDDVLGLDASSGPAPSTNDATQPSAAQLLDELLDLVIATQRPLWNGWRSGILRRYRVERLSDLGVDALVDVLANAHEFARHASKRGAST